MSFKKIIEALSENGYDAYPKEKLGFVFCSILDEEGELKLGTTSQISMQKEQYVCLYFDGNIPINKKFSSLDDLVSFIKKKYPIE